MDHEVKGDARRRVPGEASGAELQSMAPALAMGGAGPVEDSGCSATPLEAAPRVSCLEDVAPTVEPLKVGLDDDSSLEDGDEDMFDDDAFAFGDEDFQALMSHEAMRRMMHPPSPGGGSAPAAPSTAAPHALLPRHTHASFLAAKAAGAAEAGGDSSPSTRSSSFASLGALTHTSHTSCSSISSSKKTKSKRRVSLHNDVTVVPIPERTEYNLIRERIWSSGTELYQNAARNTIEFAAEGFNWRNAAEDEHFVKGPAGERIHPVHYMNLSRLGCRPLNCEQEKHPTGINASPVSMDAEPLPS